MDQQQPLNDIFNEFIFTVILILAEKFVKDYKIRDVKHLMTVVEKYADILKRPCYKLFIDWKQRNCPDLLHKMINSTLEDVHEKKTDQDYKDVYQILDYILKKKMHRAILKDLGETFNKNVKVEFKLKDHVFEVIHPQG